MNLKLLVLLLVLPFMASEAHFNISTVYIKVQTGITNGHKFFSNIGRSLSSAKESFNNLRKEGNFFGVLKQKAQDNALQALQEICSADTNREAREVLEVDRFNFVLMTPCQNHTYSLGDPQNFWTSSAFDRKKKTVILVTGWLTKANNGQLPILECISDAYLCRNDVNFVFLDTAFYMVTFYDWAALNTVKIGTDVGKRISALKNIIPSNSIHIVGHSLGAHIAGVAARTYTERTGEKIGRITGLDPAQPCFNKGGSLKGVAKGDAQYVDIIHTNPGVLGLMESIGDSDFYPNGLNPIPKGCHSSVCAHGRAWEYYAESVYPGNEGSFLSTKCSSDESFQAKDCSGNQIPMGFAEKSLDTIGNYYLDVNEVAPFGRDHNYKEMSCATC
ncbi:hypothetical protein ACFFRR_004837 [Megaselia abdita]